MFNDWLPFAIFGVFALMIPATMMIGSFVFAQRPHRRVRARTIPFESGVSQGPPKRQRFTVSFYLTAMLFILFDIEIVFLYPLAVILHELEFHGVKVVIDPFSAPYLKGSTIDFLEGLQESGFKIDNPNVVSACGCGSSFQVADGEDPGAAAGCGSGCGHSH